MRTFLHNRTTNLYLAEVSKWTSSMDCARDFKEPQQASKFVREARLQDEDLELIVAFNNSRYQAVVPLNGA